MSTDRELLEWAAKAANLNIGKWVDCWSDEPGVCGFWLDGDNWNPLADDGDALRLAVKLRMEIDHNHPADQTLWVSVRAAPVRTCTVEEFEDEIHREAATCRAIVRAAAEIGKHSAGEGRER